MPTLILGTAMWGWTTPREIAFSLLDEWYRRGFREVDAATNYPIDKNPEHFRLAENILLDWIKAHGITDLQVMMKIGSVNNLHTPEHVLTKSFVLIMLDEYGWLFGSNLNTLMVHWDNRDSSEQIRETLEGLDAARQKGLQVGLSGILHPEIYAELNREFGFDFRIQIKHNVLQSDYGRYSSFHGKRRFIAYGINAGGLKLGEGYSENSSLKARGGDISAQLPVIGKIQEVIAEASKQPDRPLLSAIHQIGLIYAFYQAGVHGILLGASSVEQLKSNIDFFQTLQQTDYRDVFQRLQNLVD